MFLVNFRVNNQNHSRLVNRREKNLIILKALKLEYHEKFLIRTALLYLKESFPYFTEHDFPLHDCPLSFFVHCRSSQCTTLLVI